MNVNILLSRLALYREVDDKTLHALGFGVYKNNIRLYIKESPTSDIRNNTLIFNMALVHMNARLIANELNELNTRKEGYNVSFPLYGKKFINNQAVDGERELTGTIGVARTKDKSGDIINILYITSPVGTKYIFPLKPTPYVDVVKNGELVKDNKVLSEMWTKAYADTFTAVLNKIPEAINQNSKSNNAYVAQTKPDAKPTIVSDEDILKDI